LIDWKDEVLTAAEVATELRCSKAQIYKAIRGDIQGVSRLPSIMIGRRRLIRRSSLEGWKKLNEQGRPDGMIESTDRGAVDA